MKKIAYVIGDQTKKSLSPLIFNYWIHRYNIKNFEYRYKQIQLKNFDKEIKKILLDNSVCGFNVTIPFKEKIIPYLDRLDTHSKKIKAVNFVFKDGNKWIGKNYDWLGFKKSLTFKNNIKNKNTAVIIGYGGASKAIIYSLLRLGYLKIKIFNRSFEKTKKLNDSSSNIKTYRLGEVNKHISSADLIINAIPNNVISPNIAKNSRKTTIVYDVVYRPKHTKFLSLFEKQNKVYGISMLVHQAAPCFHSWFGIMPKVDKELLKKLDEKIA